MPGRRRIPARKGSGCAGRGPLNAISDTMLMIAPDPRVTMTGIIALAGTLAECYDSDDEAP